MSEKISKKKISDFKLKSNYCLYCKEKFKDTIIYESGDHKENCPWNYYLICLSCGMKNKVALLVENPECICKKK